MICKSADAMALFWLSMFGLDLQYALTLTCAEMVEMQQEHNEKLDAADWRLGKNT